MYLIGGPYVSDYLKRSLVELNVPVIQTAEAIEYLEGLPINFVSESSAIAGIQANPDLQIYTNSENALDWIYQHLPENDLTAILQRVKNKVLFRQSLSQLHPNYFYLGSSLSDLASINPAELPFPVILKPSIGFFSLGVQRIEKAQDWQQSLSDLEHVIHNSNGLYPTQVLDNSHFIIEEVIPGDEFAVDCYYDDTGQVVILNMMKHLFASGADVNDRVYITSGDIMAQFLAPVQTYLNTLGQLFGLENFQAHIEIRIDDAGVVRAIEINPLRFGGWCSTPDLTQYAWDMNIYHALVKKHRPDWGRLIKTIKDQVFALVVLNNSTGVDGKKIKRFDYEQLLQKFQYPLELRKTDYEKFPLFGFLMVSVASNQMQELHEILHSDLREYITQY